MKESLAVTLSTMQDVPITVRRLFDHGRAVHARSTVTTYRPTGVVVRTFAEIADEADSFAAGLAGLGLAPGDRVATMLWNQVEHLTTYFAVTCAGWVLHPLNPRLPAAQLAAMVDEVEDRVIVVDESFLSLLDQVATLATHPFRVVVVGAGATDRGHLDYDDLARSAGQPPRPELDERGAAVICYTSGTSGAPKGVAYSHRSIFLQTQSICAPNVYGIGETDRILVSVPIYHTNAASLHLAGWSSGSSLVLPERHLQSEPLATMIETEGVTIAVGVVTLWADLLRRWQGNSVDLSSMNLIVSGGSAAPRELVAEYRARGVPLIQGWGMTESLGICAMGHPPGAAAGEEVLDYLGYAGRIVAGVEVRVVDVDTREELPWDGVSSGELEVRGPWVTAGYVARSDLGRSQWYLTGDIGCVTVDGYVRITDRLKDVIKSGGEWISSLDLEEAIRSYAGVADVAVIGIPDERWQERPLAVVVALDGPLDIAGVIEHVSHRVARWWVPERWCVVDELPRTSVGKLDKRRLREEFQLGALTECS